MFVLWSEDCSTLAPWRNCFIFRVSFEFAVAFFWVTRGAWKFINEGVFCSATLWIPNALGLFARGRVGWWSDGRKDSNSAPAPNTSESRFLLIESRYQWITGEICVWVAPRNSRNHIWSSSCGFSLSSSGTSTAMITSMPIEFTSFISSERRRTRIPGAGREKCLMSKNYSKWEAGVPCPWCHRLSNHHLQW